MADALIIVNLRALFRHIDFAVLLKKKSGIKSLKSLKLLFKEARFLFAFQFL